MLKRGIVSRDQLRRAKGRMTRQHASLLLLRALYLDSDADPVAYNSVLPLVQMANGVWRDTSSGRLATLDDAVLEVLTARSREGPLRVADVAVASGATSVDLYQRLAARFRVSFVASDIVRDAIAVRSLRRSWTVVFDSRGNVLQYVRPPFVLPGQGREPFYYPINRAIRRILMATVLPDARQQFAVRRADSMEEFVPVQTDDYELMRIPLLTKECLKLDRDDSVEFRVDVLDLLDGQPPESDLVRAMNIVTPHHLDEAGRRAAVSNLVCAVANGGLLVLGRSPQDDPAAVRASVFRRDGSRMKLLLELNGGSEVAEVVLEMTSCPT